MATLRDLGLSEYEARVYRALLQTGPTTAKELSRASDVPMGRIYDVLNSIETYNLVRSQTASRPKKYAAVEPATALDRLLEKKKEELEEKAAQYEETVGELVGELRAAEPIDEEFWTAAVGPVETVELLLERLTAANNSIVMVSGDPSPQFDLDSVGDQVARELERALERGVSVSVLISPELVRTLPKSVGRRYKKSLSTHPQFATRTASGVTGTFHLIDHVEVCIEVPNPLEREQAFAMIDLKDAGFAADIHEEFAPRWERAEPLVL